MTNVFIWENWSNFPVFGKTFNHTYSHTFHEKFKREQFLLHRFLPNTTFFVQKIYQKYQHLKKVRTLLWTIVLYTLAFLIILNLHSHHIRVFYFMEKKFGALRKILPKSAKIQSKSLPWSEILPTIDSDRLVYVSLGYDFRVHSNALPCVGYKHNWHRIFMRSSLLISTHSQAM